MADNNINSKIGGFDLANLFGGAPFISSKSKSTTLSFEINDIIEHNGGEILKLLFFNDLTARLIKYNNAKGMPCVSFDIVDESTKDILLKTDKDFIGGLGIAAAFYELNFITQWEIPLLERLCRSFVLGDIETIRDLVMTKHLRISRDAEWRLRLKLGLT